MRLKVIALLVPLAFAFVGCGVQTSASEGLTDDAEATMQMVGTEVQSLVAGEGEVTVGDVQARMGKIDGLLQTAGGQAKGLAQAAIFNFRNVFAGVAGLISDLPESAPISDLPAEFTDARSKIGTRFNDLSGKLGLD